MFKTDVEAADAFIKKYQLLKSIESSPQMPTGYPGMMIIALLQPLWFFIMNKKLKKLAK